MKKVFLIAAAILSLSAESAFALGVNPGTSTTPNAGRIVLTLRGSVVTTGRVGRMQTTTLPGGGGQGILMDNGNGTSTLIGPNGTTTTMATPR